jgi:hypothetical protein
VITRPCVNVGAPPDRAGGESSGRFWKIGSAAPPPRAVPRDAVLGCNLAQPHKVFRHASTVTTPFGSGINMYLLDTGFRLTEV